MTLRILEFKVSSNTVLLSRNINPYPVGVVFFKKQKIWYTPQVFQLLDPYVRVEEWSRRRSLERGFASSNHSPGETDFSNLHQPKSFISLTASCNWMLLISFLEFFKESIYQFFQFSTVSFTRYYRDAGIYPEPLQLFIDVALLLFNISKV